jgi:hypothetical protein
MQRDSACVKWQEWLKCLQTAQSWDKEPIGEK